MSVDTNTRSDMNPTFASEVNAFQEIQSAERNQDSVGGVNSVGRPENRTAGQNTGFPNSTAPSERGLGTMETRNNEGAGDFVRKPRVEQNFYLDEIKRRKFEKKAKSKLFVGGLVLDVREDFLHEKFEKYGEIIDACIVYEKGTNVSRGFGYVTFSNEKDAEEAIKGVDGMRINGKTLCVEFADDPKYTKPRRPLPGHRSRSRSPHRLRGRYPSPPPQYRDRYLERDQFYGRDRFYERDHYARDHYESERYYRRDPNYPTTDYYRPPPPQGYYRSPARMAPGPPVEYKDRFGRDVPPLPSRAPKISDVDHARLRVDRERLREPEQSKAYYRSASPEQGRMQARSNNSGNVGAQERGRGYSDSNSSDDDNDENSSSAKPRQVSAFPSAYLK